MPVVLYRCETWSIILREERGLRVFDNIILRKMFGTKRWAVHVERIGREDMNIGVW